MSFFFRRFSLGRPAANTTFETIPQGRPVCALVPAQLTVVPTAASLASPDTLRKFHLREFIENDQTFQSLQGDIQGLFLQLLQRAKPPVGMVSFEWVYYVWYETDVRGVFARSERLDAANWEEWRGVLLDQAKGMKTLARVDVEIHGERAPVCEA